MGVWCLDLCSFICPALDSKRDSLQFSAVLLQMFCDTLSVWGTFFKGTIVQKAQELHFQFSGTAQCLTTCSFLSYSILILVSSVGPSCHLTSPSLLLCTSETYLSPCFHSTSCSYYPSAHVALWDMQRQHACSWSSVGVSIRGPPCAAGLHVSQPWDFHLWAVFPFNKGRNRRACNGNRLGIFISSVLMQESSSKDG